MSIWDQLAGATAELLRAGSIGAGLGGVNGQTRPSPGFESQRLLQSLFPLYPQGLVRETVIDVL